MDTIDLNLLTALDALLAEGSVTRAAHRLNLSASAMSRTLTRLREATGDPLLVRAGRGLVPTPHAMALRDRVHALSRDVHTVLSPATDSVDMASLERTFFLRANEAFIAFFSVPLLRTIAETAPHVRLRFMPKPDKDATPLREGRLDLEIGVVESPLPEMRAQPLFEDALVGVVRDDHPLAAERRPSAERFVSFGHVVASPKGEMSLTVDDALSARGLKRDVRVVVPGFPDALRIARHTDLIATVPRSCLGHALTTGESPSAGLVTFEIPVDTPRFTISAIWHPRMDADQAHRWLRDVVMSLCRQAYP
ncbi:MAG: Nodulation protein D 2 [Luteibacter sp.]|uniref:LysR family transcriptional regulator n=1 Tax=Luteibacter sp. TaxID=1886636 RepID=UPI001384C4B8|nr:LysR family transcriptional regulator [Luteibacter sp.]KAF1004278.1 MAG: Nodulation protein D 2 [Luteibacter sp.]